MKQIIFLIAIACASIFITGCKTFDDETEDSKQLKENEQAILNYLSTNNITAEKTEQGVYYIITKVNSSGQEVTLGSKASMHYVGSLLSGTTIDSTSTFFNEPKEFTFDNDLNGEDVLAGLEYGVVAAKLKEGEQATFFIPYNLAYGRASRGDIPPYAVVKYDISSFEIQTEQEQIEAFIASDSLTYTDQDSVYTADIIKSDGGGLGVSIPQAGIDSNVTVSYTGRFLDGTIFDSNESFSFTIRGKDASNSEVIDGWNRAVNGMRVGDKKVIILYSDLGYGSAGNTNGGSTIPGYTILWFEITLKSVN